MKTCETCGYYVPLCLYCGDCQWHRLHAAPQCIDEREFRVNKDYGERCQSYIPCDPQKAYELLLKASLAEAPPDEWRD
jgi:hypothetical protein